MDKSEHAIIGGLAALGLYGLYKLVKHEPPTALGVFGSLIAGGLLGIVPDILEPAVSPSHRGFFHSKALLLMLIYGNYRAWQSSNLTDGQKLIISVLSVAFGSHIASDSTTPKGTPILV